MPFHNPFEVLRDLRGDRPDPPVEGPAPTTPDPPPAIRVARAVVRMERSGRGGKAVTVIDHLDIPAAERDVWLKALKAALGCGGTIEGDGLVLQGDHRKTVPALLTSRGVKKVIVG